MAVRPLFVSDTSKLKAMLRLSGGTTADVLIDEAVRQARVQFYSELGESRVTAILAYTDEENPTSANGLTRSRANSTEAMIVRAALLRTLPVQFKDADATLLQEWNREGLIRGMSSSEIQKEIARLESDILDGLQALQGVEPETHGVTATVIGAAKTARPRYPGTGIYPCPSLRT